MARHGVGTNGTGLGLHGTGLGLHVTGLGLHVTGLGVHVTELEPMARGSIPGGLFFLGCPTCPTCPTTPKFQITLSKMNAQIIIHRQKESAGFRFLCSRHYTKKPPGLDPCGVKNVEALYLDKKSPQDFDFCVVVTTQKNHQGWTLGSAFLLPTHIADCFCRGTVPQHFCSALAGGGRPENRAPSSRNEPTIQATEDLQAVEQDIQQWVNESQYMCARTGGRGAGGVLHY